MSNHSSLILDSIFYSIKDLNILKGAYLIVKPGSVCALFGRNGSGKSTLLKIAAGQILPTSGITIIDDIRIHNRSLDKRFSKIGYLPQDSMLPKNIVVKRLIGAFPSDNNLHKDPLIQRINSQNVSMLSGGERRYLEVSLLFSLNRSYFLLDEPFTGVEPLIIDLIIQRIKQESSKGKGILITDHYYHYLLEVADSAYLMQSQQCYKLKKDFVSELKELGYIG